MARRDSPLVLERRLVSVEGSVQGVGFRPFVYGLARRLNLHGLVRNDSAGVLIDVEGTPPALDDFLQLLTSAPPPLAAIDRIRSEPAPARAYPGFSIAPSENGVRRVAQAAPDAATCPACLRELFDPADRRFRYPFLNCTDCGPRLTIVRALPYDRGRTTMAGFAMCAACCREYEDPRDRRFHAQPTACPDCGPTLALRAPGRYRGTISAGEEALAGAVDALREGRIVAVKGLGGYHLACDATSGAAVRRLRERKRREAKPLALMVADLAAARPLCRIAPREAELLESVQRPIVLVAKRSSGTVACEVAPDSRELGIMLPYTPLHHLLLAALDRPLVMTSGNRSDEPIAFEDAEALERLEEIADLFLTHDRPIATRCDDSVVRVVRGERSFVRRSRGFAPRPIPLAVRLRVPVLGVGGHLKNTFCLARERSAFLSHHVGDLENLEAYRALREALEVYGRLLDLRPEVVAHDLHPEYLSTKLAGELPASERVAVQHHHAHVASCVAEHGVGEPVLGVAFDGAGLGTDGAIWGGEFLLVEGVRWQRLAHLAYVPLPGVDAAARQPWRMAAAHVWSACGGNLDRLPAVVRDAVEVGRLALVEQMLVSGLHSPPTSSVGRLFDAVASLLGLCHVARFEGEAALRLEAAADRHATRSYAFDVRETPEGWIADPGALIRGVVADVGAGRPAAEIAGAFHNALSELVLDVARRVRARTGVRRVALTGGVFQNALLAERTAVRLERGGFEALLHRRVPCNDGGLALGQAYVAGMTAGAAAEVA
ncbi:MAG: carbamoyltransferase HypF [Gemmatimonadota bacterium]